jgi:hypothetical protein
MYNCSSLRAYETNPEKELVGSKTKENNALFPACVNKKEINW